MLFEVHVEDGDVSVRFFLVSDVLVVDESEVYQFWNYKGKKLKGKLLGIFFIEDFEIWSSSKSAR